MARKQHVLFCKETRCAVCYGVWSTFDYTHSNTKKKLPLEIRQATASDLERDKEAFYLMTSQWKGSKAYRLAMKTLGFKQEGSKCPYKHK